MGMQQMITPPGNQNGQPVNQSNVFGNDFNNDGTSSTTVTTPSPVNWMGSNQPQAGTNLYWWIKYTDTGLNHGTAGVITNNNVVQPLSTAVTTPSSGIGGRNFSYIIANNSSGAPTVASGTGSVANDL